MSYIIDQWNKGEVHFHGDAIGWEEGEPHVRIANNR
jgi:hypothetical protein